MPRHRFAGFIVLMAVIVLGGCRAQKPPPAPPTPKVTVVRPATAPINDYWEYNGYLDTIDKVEVRARVKGFLSRRLYQEGEEVTGPIRWINGDVLYPGDLLYQIDKREYLTARTKAMAELEKAKADVEKAKADISNWQAQIELATVDLNRVEEAVSKSVGSKNDLDKAKASLNVNQAELAASKALLLAMEANRDSAASALHTTEIQLGYTDVRAQLSGQIGSTLVTEGNLVGQSEQTLLTGIIRNDALHVYFDLPEQDMLEYLRDAEKYKLPTPPQQNIPMSIRVPGMEWHPGEVDYVDGRVNTGTGTVRARAVIKNPLRPGLYTRLFVPGLYVQVRVPKGLTTPRLVLPEDAIMTGQEGRFVYVVNANNIVEKRVITLGPIVWKAPPAVAGTVPDGWVLSNPTPPPPPEKGSPPPSRKPILSVIAVMANLTPEDRVIVEGVQKARPGSPVDAEEWKMLPPATTN